VDYYEAVKKNKNKFTLAPCIFLPQLVYSFVSKKYPRRKAQCRTPTAVVDDSISRLLSSGKLPSEKALTPPETVFSGQKRQKLTKEKTMTNIIQKGFELITQRNSHSVDNWINLIGPTMTELREIEEKYNIYPDTLSDLLDLDELSRVEKEDDYILVIMRVPLHKPGEEIPYTTIPMGVVFTGNTVITISAAENEVIKDLAENRVRGFALSSRGSFLLHLFMRAAVYYLRYLKEINRHTASIQKELQRSVENNELIELLSYEKALVFFTTSLKSNELLIDKIHRPLFFSFTDDEQDLYEDCVTETRQAIEMSNIYSNILSGMMDAFASVISNNLNVVMKRLTVINLILMVPTLIASVFGMNIDIPFQHAPWAFVAVIGMSVGLSFFGTLFLRRLKFY
jgi:magnesium transporter